jgi:hypothetical protein
MPAAQAAVTGQKQPKQGVLPHVSGADTSKIDRTAMRAMIRKSHFSRIRLGCAARGGRAGISSWGNAIGRECIASRYRPACFAGCPDLFGSPKIRLGKLNPLLGTRHLPLMPFQ